MRFRLHLALLALFPVGPVAALDLAFGAGTEYMEWREYHPEPLLEESGFRPFVQLDGSSPVSSTLDLGFLGRLYGGEVDYNGQLMNGTPIKSTTGYVGVIGEAGGAWRLGDLQDEGLALVARAGVDAWERDLKGSSGYREQYQMLYLRLGAQDEAPAGQWSARGGLLLPLRVNEKVNLAGGFELQPKGRPGVYLDFGRRIGRNKEVGVAFRRYRFDASNPVSVDLNGDGTKERVFQPTSEADIYSIYGRFGF